MRSHFKIASRSRELQIEKVPTTDGMLPNPAAVDGKGSQLFL